MAAFTRVGCWAVIGVASMRPNLTAAEPPSPEKAPGVRQVVHPTVPDVRGVAQLVGPFILAAVEARPRTQPGNRSSHAHPPRQFRPDGLLRL